MHEPHIRIEIQRALNAFIEGNLSENTTNLLRVLGYESQRTLNRPSNTVEAFLEDFDNHGQMHREKAHLHEWDTADFLFQLTADEIKQYHFQETINFAERGSVDNAIYHSYLFLAIKLKGNAYSRRALVNITREINWCYAMPALLIFQHGHALIPNLIENSS